MAHLLIPVCIAAVGIVFAVRGWLIRTRVLRYIDIAAEMSAKTEPCGDLIVIVPLLDEHARLPGLVEHFVRLFGRGEFAKLVLATTSRELDRSDGMSTRSMCEKYSKKYPWLSHYHIQDPGGNMATQINGVLRECPDICHDSVIAIYNADSRPLDGSLRWAYQRVRENPMRLVAQQHALYVRNWKSLERCGTLSRSILRAAAAYQCRWSSAFERYCAARAEIGDGWDLCPRFNYVIGHGLVVSRGLLGSCGDLTAKFPNEDAYLSLELAARRVRVLANPFWEIADSTDSVRGLFIQQRVWFAGPASAFRYYRCVDVPGESKRRSFGSALRLYNHAVCWLCGPVCAFGCLIAGVFTPIPWVSAAVAIGVCLYTGLPDSAAARLAVDRAGGTLTVRALVETVLGGPVAYFLHGAAAFWSATLLVAEALFAVRPSKPRTPMRVAG